MGLELMILVIVMIFTLFTLFIYCYDSENKKRGRFESKYRTRPIADDLRCRNPNTLYVWKNRETVTTATNPNPNNIGFNVTTTIGGSSTDFAPVGVAPGVYPSQPTPYPPSAQPPYPVVESGIFPRPETTSLRPSAPVQDNTEPPSYYEATKHEF